VDQISNLKLQAPEQPLSCNATEKAFTSISKEFL